MKKFLLVIITILAIIVFVFAGIYHTQIATIMSIEKIDDYPIYTMDYKGDYWFDDYMKTAGAENGEELSGFLMNKLSHGLIKNSGGLVERAPMCTCFVCRDEDGNILYCRNLEQRKYCPSVVITTEGGTYGSIGTSFLMMSEEGTPEILQKINMLAEPYETADGMNEAGVAVSLLSVPFSALPECEDGPVLTAQQVCRLILDEAGSVEEAIALFDTFTLNASILEQLSACHFLIADKSGAMVVVELHDKIVDVVEPIHDNYMTVTNFYLNDQISSGIGQARYKIVEETLEQHGGVLSVDEAIEVLASLKDPFVHVEWTSVYNLTTGEMYIMPKGDLERIYKVR